MSETRQILDVQGRVAVVTGAGQGVGRQIALDLAAHGAGAVVVNDIDAGRAEQVAEEIRRTGTKAVGAQCDVVDFDAVGAMFAAAKDSYGPVGVLVNNAGNQGGDAPPPSVPFWEQGPEQWAPSVGVNLHGVLNCSRHALAHMVESETGGRIVTVISDAGRVGEIGGLEAYSGAKAGAAGLTRALARLGGRYQVTANSVALGATRTPATEQFLADPERNKRILSQYMVRRLGEPADASGMVVFLASAAASWITGQTVPVNGGYSVTL
ncbi:oxidoreductase [Prauserella marina]|uniref:3-oxoacyl-[acyl-carrier protein] reductase n=1 Tax=Prauserella marina TaxID=530584 RepID=A0A222VW14_9PSEU|nr:SDR family oxidoreductase [Prauserella marina]ASR38095.1 oxidoreductase [Prauserella marina]PWV78748.1 3-oxoacyl-[acyl-carrier protein] reductase [Prauserella marina]SDC92763.1 3-oxoacyl-[acyl-carrier protein] reductase [Prauserella marina]